MVNTVKQNAINMYVCVYVKLFFGHINQAKLKHTPIDLHILDDSGLCFYICVLVQQYTLYT